jgi:hypothetical protein
MLMERWERFRGVDRWPEVMAVITCKTSRYFPTRFGRPGTLFTSIAVDYRSPDGVLRSKTIRYWLKGCSLDVGDEFYIRCSTQDASKIYIREAAQDQFLAAVVVAISAFAIWLRERYR